jgi:hypothetical protein
MRSMRGDARMGLQSIFSSEGRSTLKLGMKTLGHMGSAWMGGNDELAGLASKAFGSAFRTMGRRGMYSGAMMGAAGGGALQMGSNIMSGDNLLAGVPGAMGRGAFYGGATGLALGMGNWAGRRGQTAINPYNATRSPVGGGRAFNAASTLRDMGIGPDKFQAGSFGHVNRMPSALRNFYAARNPVPK